MRHLGGAKNHPLVLVLMAVHNGARWVSEQAETIISQTNVTIDLVVSDDASTDASIQQLQTLIHTQQLRLLTPPSATGSAAQNFLWMIQNAPLEKHDYVAFSDQDDLWDPGKISRACSSLANSGAGGYSCAVTAFWPNGKEICLFQNSGMTKSDFLLEGAGQGCTFVLTSAFFRRLKQFLASSKSRTQRLHYHDWAIYALARTWSVEWIFDPRSMMRYRQHNTNDTGARASFGGVKRRLLRLKDGWYYEQLEVIASLCAAAGPTNELIARWNRLLAEPRSFQRRLTMVQFFIKGGRRRASDNIILVIAALFGWI